MISHFYLATASFSSINTARSASLKTIYFAMACQLISSWTRWHYWCKVLIILLWTFIFIDSNVVGELSAINHVYSAVSLIRKDVILQYYITFWCSKSLYSVIYMFYWFLYHPILTAIIINYNWCEVSERSTSLIRIFNGSARSWPLLHIHVECIDWSSKCIKSCVHD